MAIDLLREFEEIPETYPSVTPFNRLDYIFDEDAPVSDAQVWQRIESYIWARYTPRVVVWTIIGNAGDEFVPRLSPMVSYAAALWSDQWGDTTLQDGPLGVCLPCDGTYRITAQVGGGDLPAAVSEAYKRLHEYTRGINDSFKNETADIRDDGNEIARNWTAKALQLSGAADLLRPYRRQK